MRSAEVWKREREEEEREREGGGREERLATAETSTRIEASGATLGFRPWIVRTEMWHLERLHSFKVDN